MQIYKVPFPRQSMVPLTAKTRRLRALKPYYRLKCKEALQQVVKDNTVRVWHAFERVKTRHLSGVGCVGIGACRLHHERNIVGAIGCMPKDAWYCKMIMTRF